MTAEPGDLSLRDEEALDVILLGWLRHIPLEDDEPATESEQAP